MLTTEPLDLARANQLMPGNRLGLQLLGKAEGD
jgi:hypothetical protein